MRRALPATAVFAAVVFMTVAMAGGTAQATTQSLGQATAIQAPAGAAADPKPKFGACGSPKSYTHLKAGKYTFLVRGVNSAGVESHSGS